MELKLNRNVAAYAQGLDDLNVVLREPLSLLTFCRFDLIPKVIYAEDRLGSRNSKWARDLYLAHIEALNGFVEADESEKIGADQFLFAFDALIDSMRRNGFDARNAVPVTSSGRILDGAHRVAAAIALRKPVPTISVSSAPPHDLSAAALSCRGMREHVLATCAAKYAELDSSSRLILVWPAARGEEASLQRILNKYCDVVFSRKLRLSRLGRLNIVREAYRGEAWLGSSADDFIGVKNKASWCFPSDGDLRIFLATGSSNWLGLKEEIRDLFAIEKNSVHITDTANEAVDLCRLLLTKAGLHYLNNSVPEDYSWFTTLTNHFNAYLARNAYSPNDFCLLGSSVLSAYGVREARDLDFVSLAQVSPTGFKEIDHHDGELEHFGLSATEIICNPDCHFWFGGHKFLAAEHLKRIKAQRREQKDLRDLDLLKTLENDQIKPRIRPTLTAAHVKGRVKFYLLWARFNLRRLTMLARRAHM
ncbi:hypothetical protein EZ313_18010 [Ramlibacter henchirensis]|uniref:ParB/Sulfiredoxin domain-containing protein n=1 Tax=Ramlibacter henchirensis TaxID=204072 RepID=A0A4Z0BUV5_9BURK|nr:hypothetical protein [Ramlibacter henchirensis]TFZ03107.1 hypothetical protein EZ313_18010 [Ramlibacter henchirensis]